MISNHPSPYYLREIICYIYSMVDLGLVRSGLLMVCNARNTTWRNFKPYEMRKIFKTLLQCVPLKVRRRLVIDPGIYFLLARKVFTSMFEDNMTVVLTLDEARHRYPHAVLPTSLTGLVENKLIKRLSANEQLTFNFFIEP